MNVILPSDAEIARLCNSIYDYPGYAPTKWDHLVVAGDDAFAPSYGIKRIGDVDCIIFRGSTTTPDWLRDFRALADPFVHGFLGPVHPGFYQGLPAALKAILPLVGEQLIVAGHSLGAGEASIFAGLLVEAKRPPLARVVFGEPRPGFPQLGKILARVPGRSYRNGNGEAHDLVTDVPFAIGIEDYVHPTPMSAVCEVPSESWRKEWSIFAWHGMPLYLAALEAKEGLPPSGPVDAAVPFPGHSAPHLAIH